MADCALQVKVSSKADAPSPATHEANQDDPQAPLMWDSFRRVSRVLFMQYEQVQVIITVEFRTADKVKEKNFVTLEKLKDWWA